MTGRVVQENNRRMMPLLMIVLCFGLLASEISCSRISKNPPQGAPPLWHRAKVSGELPRSPETVKIIPVTVDVKRLESTDNTNFSLLLPDGRSITVVKVRQELVGGDGFVWHGKVEKNPYSFVTFSVVDQTVMGSFIGPRGEIYRLRHGKGSDHYVEKVDVTRRLLPMDRPVIGPAVNPKTNTSGQTCNTDVPDADGLWPIDVMVAYTQDALTGAGGNTNMLDTIDLAIGEANESYRQSGIKQKLNLVCPLTEVPSTVYTEKDYPDYDLDDMSNGRIKDNQGNTLETLRENYGADVVVLIVEKTLGAAGMSNEYNSFLPNSSLPPYSVVVRQYATGLDGGFSFTHELGHVMGANHDYGDEDPGNQYPFDTGYNHGLVRDKPISSSAKNISDWYPWLTVMATYNDCSSCVRVPIWSSSDSTITWEGDATGDARHDNARMLNETASKVANFKCHKPPPPTCPSPPTNLDVK